MSSVVDIHKKKGIRPEFDVYIGRRIQYHKEFTKDSKWANRSSNLEAYENWIRYVPRMWNALDELEGKVLGCWCVNTDKLEPVQCHGQILMKLVQEKLGAPRMAKVLRLHELMPVFNEMKREAKKDEC